MRLILLLALPLLLGACSDGFKAKSLGGASSSAGGGSYAPDDAVALVPASDRIDAACMTSDQFDTCLFRKSPVAQQNSALAASTRAAVASMQTYGVRLTGLNASGFLENAHFRITTSRTTRLALSGNKKPLATAAATSDLEQLMTYYYMNRAIEYMIPRGPLAVRGQNINVVVDERANGFHPASRAIHLRREADQLPASFDASVPIYLLGLANAHLASGGALNNIAANDTNHRACGLDAKGCCASSSGCARALAAGAALYFAAVVFPNQPAVGELDANRVAGARLCAVADRDLRNVANQTVAAAHQLCVTRVGDANILGNVYASIWWQLRGQVEADAYALDFLYLQHLSRLNASDTFSTAKQKILDLDRDLLEGRFNDRINAEFTRRGL